MKAQEIQQKTEADVENAVPHYLVFELGYTGHYPHYIRHLSEFWLKQRNLGRLTFVVSPQFAQHHSEVLTIGQSEPSHRLSFQIILENEADGLTPRQSPRMRAQRSLQEWALLRQYAQRLQATHCLLLYFDSFQTAILLKQPLPCPFSGIYFRPTLHYSTFGHYAPTRKERFQEWREQLVLPFVTRHPQLQHLFCLDPFFTEFAQQRMRLSNATYLPDPVEVDTSASAEKVTDFKRQLGIDPQRTTCLLFGALYDRRKGIAPVLDALVLLTKEQRRSVCLLLVGQLDEQSPLQAKIDEIKAAYDVQVVIRSGFVPNEEVALCFQATDVVLAPYQRHVGMSGILVHAAAAQKPLIASNYGLLGELVRQNQLGLTVEAAKPESIATAIKRVLSGELETIGDRANMKNFARQNCANNFARLIFQMLDSSTAKATQLQAVCTTL